ncbi:MAG: hypothetical protein GEU79_02150 [Acidimicrobiia bacterium]|nr:hypothetical protein [Acidimicrobiia bacterium]
MMARLDGGSHPVDLAPGYSLTAPGLLGEATAHDAAPPGTRRPGVEESTEALDLAFESASVNEIRLIEVSASSAPGGGGRGESAEPGDELILDIPDLGGTVGQAVMAVDEGGGITWHLPEHLGGGTQRGGEEQLRFRIPVDPTYTTGAEDEGDRSLIGTLGTTLLKVVVYPITDPILGPVLEDFARRWEEKRRPNRLRWYGLGENRQKGANLTDIDLGELASGRSLWFVHGTFSTANSAFSGLSNEALERLHQNYGGRVVAFEHHTLSMDPTGNLSWLGDRLKGAPDLEIDIVSHSRGGLVSRVLSGETGGIPGLEVGQAVLVGTPNYGTVLADPDHVLDFIDRISTILNVFPPGPASIVAEVLEAVLTVLKVVGSAGLRGLSGLASMNPSGDYLRGLDPDARGSSLYRAMTSNFEPGGPLVRTIGVRAKDLTFDRVFEDEANDLIVPTLGVYQGTDGTVFPLDDILEFSRDDRVQHSGFFSHPKAVAQLETWLQG